MDPGQEIMLIEAHFQPLLLHTMSQDKDKPFYRVRPRTTYTQSKMKKKCPIYVAKQATRRPIINSCKPLTSATFTISGIFPWIAHTGPWLAAGANFCCWATFENDFALCAMLAPAFKLL